MEIMQHTGTSDRYASLIGMGLDIDRDIIHASKLTVSTRFVTDGVSRIERLPFLDAGDKRLVSQIQSRTFANLFGLVERFIAAKVLELTSNQRPGDRIALAALERLAEALEQQEMFRNIERMAAAGMAEGYAFLPEPNAVATLVHGKSVWAVLGLVCHIELSVLAQYRESIDLNANLSALCKDVFLYHWREASTHAVLAEVDWMHENARLSAEQRDRAVDELIELVAAVDGILQSQSQLDTDYLLRIRGRTLGRDEAERIRVGLLDAYRWHYVVPGMQGQFGKALSRFTTPVQRERIGKALSPSLS